MDTITRPTALYLAVLAEWHPASRRPERIHAVLGWTDAGGRIYQPLATPRLAPAVLAPLTAELSPPHVAEQLHLDVDECHLPVPCSSGSTWRTWVLPSVPATLRHLPPAGVVEALARRLEADR